MSDPPLTTCPQCGQSTYVKQVTAAGFQLKGTGWYVTDFRDNGSRPADKKTSEPAPSSPSTGDGAAPGKPAPAPASAAPPSSAPPTGAD